MTLGKLIKQNPSTPFKTTNWEFMGRETIKRKLGVLDRHLMDKKSTRTLQTGLTATQYDQNLPDKYPIDNRILEQYNKKLKIPEQIFPSLNGKYLSSVDKKYGQPFQHLGVPQVNIDDRIKTHFMSKKMNSR